jgi:hypothetical protein
MLRLTWIPILLVAGCGSATLRSSDGGAGQGGGAAWCTQQTIPAGVTAADHGCVDFDDAKLPSGGAWTSMISNGGTSAVTTQHASSLPDGWQTSVGTGDGSTAALAWHAAGAQPIASLTVSVDISPIASQGVSPPWTGSVSLLCVAFGSGRACLQYTVGEDTGFASAYTGYYLTMDYEGGGATFSKYPIAGFSQPGLWTRIQMQIAASSKQIQVTIPGATNAAVTGDFDPDTAVDVTVGPQTSGSTSGWSGYLDNVVIDAARSR